MLLVQSLNLKAGDAGISLSLLTEINKCFHAVNNALSKEMKLMTITVKFKGG